MIREHYFDNNIGRGLIAETNIAKSTVIFQESPLVQIQYSWNKKYRYLACDECMRPLENVEENLRRLTGDHSLIVPSREEFCKIAPLKSGFCSCDGCQTSYCSVDCRQKAAHSYHKFMCPANGFVSKEFLEKFEQLWNEIHYPPETSNIMILVKMVAMVHQAQEHRDDVIGSFAKFCQSTFNESNYFIHKILDEKYDNQLKMLFELFQKNLFMECIGNWFTFDGFRNLIALVCRNSQGIATSSFSLWLKEAENRFKGDENFETFVEEVYEKIDEHVGQFIDNEGIGLFQTQSLINHSCSPNCEVRFSGEDSKLSVVALRDISCGEQLSISYLDECQLNRSRHSRQKYLKEYYLFSCVCEKCESQKIEPDETSDEEEDSDDAME